MYAKEEFAIGCMIAEKKRKVEVLDSTCKWRQDKAIEVLCADEFNEVLYEELCGNISECLMEAETLRVEIAELEDRR